MTEPELDIVIPAYREGTRIVPVLRSFDQQVRTPYRVTVCCDDQDDPTLEAVRIHGDDRVRPILNRGRGAFEAVVTALEASTAPAMLVYPADDDYNAARVDAMVDAHRRGADVVVASRFIPGGGMHGCPPLKAILVRLGSLALRHLARVPAHDASNGLRLFSRRVIERIPLESTVGFAYSLEYLVKAHRLGWTISEVPALWIERRQGSSRFRVVRWLPGYLRWIVYAMATTYLRRGPGSVRLLA